MQQNTCWAGCSAGKNQLVFYKMEILLDVLLLEMRNDRGKYQRWIIARYMVSKDSFCGIEILKEMI